MLARNALTISDLLQVATYWLQKSTQGWIHVGHTDHRVSSTAGEYSTAPTECRSRNVDLGGCVSFLRVIGTSAQARAVRESSIPESGGLDLKNVFFSVPDKKISNILADYASSRKAMRE